MASNNDSIYGNGTELEEANIGLVLETVYFSMAFLCGFIAVKLELPPLVGFIASGFVLNLMGFDITEGIEIISSLGVTLLLFTIGLKLDIRILVKKEVWITATTHIIISSFLLASFLLFFSIFKEIPLLGDLDFKTTLLLGFSLSFSSTVFAIKILEEYGEMSTLHGRIAVGILILQDLFAVIFLAATTGKKPNAYALCLLGLPIAQKIVWYILEHSRHGEILTLFGMSFSLVAGYQLFEFCGLKGNLGALVTGVLLHSHDKSSELSKSLLKLKDLMLVGFFLEIGLNATLTLDPFYIALLLLLLLPFKMIIYYVLTNLVFLRARTSLLISFALADYSEFGLIVVDLAVSQGMLPGDWLTVIAVAVALTFIVASPPNVYANDIYMMLKPFLYRFQRDKRVLEEEDVSIGDATVVIVGMGRIGEQVYKTLLLHGYEADNLVGIDVNQSLIQHVQNRNIEVRINMICTDASDPDFWRNSDFTNVKLIIFAMPKHRQNVFGLQQLLKAPFYKGMRWGGKLAARVRYEHEEKELRKKYNVSIIYDSYDRAGIAFGRYIIDSLGNECTAARLSNETSMGSLESGTRVSGKPVFVNPDPSEENVLSNK